MSVTKKVLAIVLPIVIALILIFSIVMVSIVGAFGIVICINAVKEAEKEAAKDELQRNLMANEWCCVDGSLLLYLDFSSYDIDYSARGAYIGRKNISTIYYTVIDGDTIEVYGREVDVQFGDGYVVFRPSFVDSDSMDLWVTTAD